MVEIKDRELEGIQKAVKESSGENITEREAHILREALKTKEKK